MKLKFTKDCRYAFDHINATEFVEGQEFPTINKKFIAWALDNGLAVEVKPKLKKKSTPKSTKRAKGPSENK